MRRLRISPLAAFGLLVLIGLNGLTFSWLSRMSGREDRLPIAPLAWRPDLPADNQASPSQSPGQDNYTQTLARPIFFRDRRPYKPPPAPPKPKPAPPKPKPAAPSPPVITNPGLSLAGVAITREAKQAFVKHPSGTNGSWVKEGEAIMGWRVNEITPGRIMLEKAGHSIELPLYGRTANP